MKEEAYPKPWGWRPMPLPSDEWRTVPGKKNRRKWCKGKLGAEHVLVVTRTRWQRDADCHVGYRADLWVCYHETCCSVCGRKIDHGYLTPCPDKPKRIPYGYGKSRELDSA